MEIKVAPLAFERLPLSACLFEFPELMRNLDGQTKNQNNIIKLGFGTVAISKCLIVNQHVIGCSCIACIVFSGHMIVMVR